MTKPLTEQVRDERRRRDLSIRQAAAAGGISHTTWANFEKGAKPLGPNMRLAAAVAFDWPHDWCAKPADRRRADALARLSALEKEVSRLRLELANVVAQDERRIADELKRRKGGRQKTAGT